LTGVLSAIPNFGMLLATVVAGLVAILDGVNMWVNSPAWLEGLIILAIFFVFNKFVDLILAPIFLGATNKVNPFILLLIVLAGTIFFGIWGAILSVPLFLTIKTVIEHFSGQSK
jgi:predicted PurR-regulated permease PerM